MSQPLIGLIEPASLSFSQTSTPSSIDVIEENWLLLETKTFLPKFSPDSMISVDSSIKD